MCLYPVPSFDEIDYSITVEMDSLLEHQLAFLNYCISSDEMVEFSQRDDVDVFSDRLASEPFG